MDIFSDIPSTTLSLLSSEDYEITSTLQYVNAQLVSHGFVRSPGLSLEGLANDDSERLVKCLLGMLSQRLADLQQTEDLGSKLRVLNYELERLKAMHQNAVDFGANTEREMHLFKSKLAGSQKSLVAETAAHKQTVSELQRTRTSLQYLRSTTQNELKRKDMELERVMDRWTKVADAQAKLLVTPSGLRCANFAAETLEIPQSQGLMEQALEKAEEARSELGKENDAFRNVLLGAANALQDMVYTVKSLPADAHVEKPSPLTHPALFAPPISMLLQPENAHAKLRELFTTLREAISNVSSSATANADIPKTEEEIKRLNELVTSLRTELEQSRQSSTALATQSQAILDRFTIHASERLISGKDPTSEQAAEMSLELMSVPEQDEVRAKLDARAADLRKERERFTEAAVKLGKERAELVAERMNIVEEKRRWAVEQMLAELPPTPGPAPDLIVPSQSNKATQNSLSPPRVRSRKVSSLGSPLKNSTSMKRISITADKPVSQNARKKLKERRQSGMFGTLEVLYEPESGTEDQPSDGNPFEQRSTTPEDPPPITVPSAVAAEMKTSLPLVLPTTFTFPPPSPASSITMERGPIPSPSPPAQQQQQTSLAIPRFDSIPLATTSTSIAPASALPNSRTFPSPRTPRIPPNPFLKHAYSPVRPSPLSRMLMLADSPPSPPSMPPIQEEHEKDQNKPPLAALPQRVLSRELAVPADEPSPLRERTGGNLNLNRKNGVHTGAQEPGGNGKRFTAKEKGKGREAPAVQGLTASEKENMMVGAEKKAKASLDVSNVKSKMSKTSTGPDAKKLTGVRPISKPAATKCGAAAKIASGSGATAGTSTTGGAQKPGGARRVPVGSATTAKLGVKKA